MTLMELEDLASDKLSINNKESRRGFLRLLNAGLLETQDL